MKECCYVSQKEKDTGADNPGIRTLSAILLPMPAPAVTIFTNGAASPNPGRGDYVIDGQNKTPLAKDA